MTRDQNKLYQKGYRAGIKAGAAASVALREQARFDAFLAVAMNGLLARGRAWGTTIDGVFKPDRDADSYAHTAAQIARAMMGKHP